MAWSLRGTVLVSGLVNRLLRPGGTALHGPEQTFEVAANQPVEADPVAFGEVHDVNSK